MSAQNNEVNPCQLVIEVGTQAADITLPVLHLNKKGKILSAHLMDQAGVAADNTNYMLISLKSGSTVIGSYDTRAAGQGALTALVASALSLVALQQERAKSEDLSLAIDANGTVTLTKAKLVLSYLQY